MTLCSTVNNKREIPFVIITCISYLLVSFSSAFILTTRRTVPSNTKNLNHYISSSWSSSLLSCGNNQKEDQDRSTFRSWCDDVSIEAPKLTYGRSDEGIPGVFVREGTSLKPNENAIVLPAEAAILSLGDIDGESTKSQLPKFLGDKLWTETNHHYRLALLLVNEMKKGQSSHVSGYVDHLPPISGPGKERNDSLVRWNEEELKLLKSPELVGCVADRRERVDSYFDHFVSCQEGNEKFMTRDEFYWALSCVTTRSFAGNFSGRTGVEDHALLPVIDDINHAVPLNDKRDGGVEYAPTLMVGEALSFDVENDQFKWTAKDKYEAGVELTQGYLRGVNENFLLSWGFTPSINEDDQCRLNIKDVHFTIRHDGKVVDSTSVITKLQNQDGDDCTKEKAWDLVAHACKVKGEKMNAAGTSNGEEVEMLMSDTRCEIAARFVEDRMTMLKKGQRVASYQADAMRCTV